MDPRRYETLKDLFLKGRELREPSRSDFVAELRKSDPALATELERLLASDDAEAASEDGAALPGRPETLSGATHPDRIAGYRILRVLGTGGMGIVYEAEQERPSRRVALKVIRPGLADPRLLRRFELESEALARLDHPGIARIFEYGTTAPGDGGLPFFSMELVRGTPLTEAAASRRLDPSARLELVARVADAADHAHRQGVIHRDLKPANILVGDALDPKILDFGVARFTEARSPSLATESGLLLGTIAYMSPEQAQGHSSRVGPWTDVYSLGVIAYELLAGVLPYPIEGEPIPRALRVIGEMEPVPIGRLRPDLRGDVETILAKALAKEQGHRYGSASDFGADLRRVLRHEPILARPQSRLYVLSRFVRRHRALVASLALSAVLLLGGAVAATLLAWRADSERRRADGEARKAEDDAHRAAIEARVASEALEFMIGTFEAATPERARGESVTARTLLDRGVARIATEAALDDGVRARLLVAMGRCYGELALYPEGGRLIDQAVELLGPRGPADPADRALALAARARIAMGRGSPAEALEPATESLALVSACVSDADPRRLTRLVDLGIVLRANGRIDDAAARLREALGLLRTVQPAPRNLLARCLSALGAIHLERQEDPAEALLTEALALREAALPADDPDLVDPLNSLAVARMQGRRSDEAEVLFRRALDIDAKVFPEGHPRRIRRLVNLASCLSQQGRTEAARPLLEEACAQMKRTSAPGHPEFLKAWTNLARLCRDAGDLDRALELGTESLDAAEAALGPRHALLAPHHVDLAFTLSGLGRHDEAVRHAETALAIEEASHGTDSVLAGQACCYLAELLLAADRLEDAASAFERAFVIQAPRDVLNLDRTYRGYAAVLRGLDRTDDLSGLRRRFQAARRGS